MTAMDASAACAASAWNWESRTVRDVAVRYRWRAANMSLEADLVVFAIGTRANPIMGQTSRMKINEHGYITVDDDLASSVAGVFAGGDIVTGAATVIEAMGAGPQAARTMKAYLGIREAGTRYAG